MINNLLLKKHTFKLISSRNVYWGRFQLLGVNMFASVFIFLMGLIGLLLSVSEFDILWFISSLSLVFVSSDNIYQVKTGKSVIAKLHFFKSKHQK